MKTTTTIAGAAIANVLAEALAYEAEQFDGGLSVSGADLVNWFAGWRTRLREALASPDAEPANLFAALKLVMPLACSHVEDWRSGIEDGTYDTEAECVAAEANLALAESIMDRPRRHRWRDRHRLRRRKQ